MLISTPHIAQSFLAYINSFAASTYPTQANAPNFGQFAPVVPVTIYHKKTNAPVPITGGMLVDTGAEDTMLNEKYAKAIDLDYKVGPVYNVSGAGGKVGGAFYRHRIPIKLGGLKPIAVPVMFGPQLIEDQVLGRGTLRQFITTLTQQQIKLAEYQAATKSAYVKAWHAAILNGSNSQSHYNRNRM